MADDGFTTHMSKSKKKTIRNEVLRKFLLSDELKNTCILHLMGKCRRGTGCSFDHVDLSDTIYAFSKDLYYDFTHIEGIQFRRVDIIRFILGIFGDDRSINLTNCTFHQKGTICHNEKKGNFIKFPMKFKNKDMTLHICYAENSRFTLCGMHIDYVIEETRSKFKVTDIISKPQELHLHRRSRDDDADTEPVDFESKEADFPELNSDRGSVSSEVSYTSSLRGYNTVAKVKPFQRKAGVKIKDMSADKNTSVMETIVKIHEPASTGDGKIMNAWGKTKTVSASAPEPAPVRTPVRTPISKSSFHDFAPEPAVLSAEREIEENEPAKKSVAAKKKAKKRAKKARLEAKAKAEAEAEAKAEATDANKKRIIETTAKVVVDKLFLSNLTADNFEDLAEQIFMQKINPDETDAMKIERLEKENIILFKRNIELTDELQNFRMFDKIEKNLDMSADYLKRRYGDKFDVDYDSDDSWCDEETENKELNDIPKYTSDVNLMTT